MQHQYVFFEKGIRSVQRGLEQSPRSWGISRIFVLKVKNWGSRIYYCYPNNFVGAGGATAPPATRSRAYDGCPEKFLRVPEYAHGYFICRNFSWAFVLIDPMNVRTKFEVHSFTHS